MLMLGQRLDFENLKLNKIQEDIVMSKDQKTSFKDVNELKETIFNHFSEFNVGQDDAQKMIDAVIKLLAYGGDFTPSIINDHLKENELNYFDLEKYSLELVLTLFKLKTGRDVKFTSFEH